MFATRTLLALLIACVVAPSAGATQRQELDQEDDLECSIQDSPDNRDVHVTWKRDAAGGIQPEVVVRGVAGSDATYILEGRVRIGRADVSWSQGPYTIDALEELSVPLQLPAQATAHPELSTYLGDLMVYVKALDPRTDAIVARASAQRAFVARAAQRLVFLDQAAADILAPYRVIGGPAALGLPEPDTDDGVLLGFSPSASVFVPR